MAGTFGLGLIPRGAERLVAARLDGKEPDEMVFVSFNGMQPDYLDNYQMIADVKKRYDWRFLMGLDVCLLVQHSLPGLHDVLLDIARTIRPGRAYAWDVDDHVGTTLYALPDPTSIDRPPNSWRWHLDDLPWTQWQNEYFLNGPKQLHGGLPRDFFCPPLQSKSGNK